jgi:hypothetical protein
MKDASTSFLDTTTFADRLFGKAAEKKRIDELLALRPAHSSSFVREQFRATFLRAAVLLYNVLEETRSPAEALRRTDDFDFFRRGEGAKARKILAAILEHPDIDINDGLATLERLIEIDLVQEFDRMVSVTDETGCCRCPEQPNLDENGVYRFPVTCALKPPQPCKIEGFWASRREALDRLSAIPTSSPRNENIEEASKAAAEVIAGKPPRGRRCAVHLSDPAIVAESPDGCVLITTNVKDFQPLASAFGGTRSVVTYRATAKK